jgi:hypothetical protein
VYDNREIKGILPRPAQRTILHKRKCPAGLVSDGGVVRKFIGYIVVGALRLCSGPLSAMRVGNS